MSPHKEDEGLNVVVERGNAMAGIDNTPSRRQSMSMNSVRALDGTMLQRELLPSSIAWARRIPGVSPVMEWTG